MRLSESTCIILLIIIGLFIIYKLFTKFAIPYIFTLKTKDGEKNPDWLISRLHYYGFHDIDIILMKSDSVFTRSPHFILNHDRYELYVPDSVSVDDAEDIGKLALLGKLYVKYGVLHEDKPLYWLSILCYMLDGGGVDIADILWKNHKN